MASKKKNRSIDPNFIDLRQTPQKKPSTLIHDVRLPFGKSRRIHRYTFFIVLGVLILLVGGIAITRTANTESAESPVPVAIQSSVDFPVYYPKPATLPAGYILDTNSFNSASNVVAYTINAPANNIISVSVQSLPPSQQLATFHNQRLPLFTNVKTPIGTARVSALNNRSLTSLPTKDAWILISAPYDADAKQLTPLLQSFTDPGQ